MNIDATFRPIHRWPRPETRDRQPSRFRASWGNTLQLLKRELRHLRARAVVIQLDLREEDIRLDGYPRANARTASPRVILSFETSDGAFSYPCDTWTDWQDNVRAIALTLENLRAIDRYGVTKHAEQYRGWRALPGAGEARATISVEDAAEILVRMGGGDAGELIRDPRAVTTVYRRAAKAAHPDAGGSVAEFQLLQAAMAVLASHHAGGAR